MWSITIIALLQVLCFFVQYFFRTQQDGRTITIVKFQRILSLKIRMLCCSLDLFLFYSFRKMFVLISVSFFDWLLWRKETLLEVAMASLSLATWTGFVSSMQPVFSPSSSAPCRWQKLQLSISHSMDPGSQKEESLNRTKYVCKPNIYVEKKKKKVLPA